MEQVKKIKVAWICHFSNAEVRNMYPRDTKRPIYHFVRKILGLSNKDSGSGDFAPWVTGAIEEIKKRDDIELHIISPQTDIKGKTCEFEIDGVYYYFFNPNFTLFLMHVIKDNERWRKWQNSSKYVNKFIDKINPDIINLIGAENPYHSCTVLDIKVKVPVLITLQTFYTNPNRLKYAPAADKSKNWYIDGLIHKRFKYFTLTGKLYNDLLRKENPNVLTFAFSFCGMPYPKVKKTNIEYDFVDFSVAHSKKKGGIDAIKALAIVKKKYPAVTLNMVGEIPEEDKGEFLTIIKKYNLTNNIVFTPFFEKQADMFQHIQKSKFALLPIKMDVISGTILQAMHFGLPVVTYKTSGTPYLNVDKQRVLIADLENVNQLADNMVKLMDNPELSETLKINAKEYSDRNINNALKIDYLVADYKAILDNYYNGTSIPERLLFNENKIGL